MLSKKKKNLAIAEWLEPCPTWERNCRGRSPIGAWERRRLREWRDGKAQGYWDDQPCDFLTDEAANALILEKMHDRGVQLRSQYEWIDGKQRFDWRVYYFVPVGDCGAQSLYHIAAHQDRKAAICEAALKLIKVLSVED